MSYPRDGRPEDPFEYLGYTIQIITFQYSPGDWRGSYRIALAGENVARASVDGVYDEREGALENVTAVAKAAVQALIS